MCLSSARIKRESTSSNEFLADERSACIPAIDPSWILLEGAPAGLSSGRGSVAPNRPKQNRVELNQYETIAVMKIVITPVREPPHGGGDGPAEVPGWAPAADDRATALHNVWSPTTSPTSP
jgi:hypothetical protein